MTGRDPAVDSGGRLEVFVWEPPDALVSVGTIPDEDEMWGSLGAWENAESELIDTLGLWLAQQVKPPGAYRLVCTDQRGEMCSVDHIHGVRTQRGTTLRVVRSCP